MLCIKSWLRRTCGTGRTNSARRSFNTLRPLRTCGTRCAGRTDCACCTRNTLWADGARRSGCANRAGGSGYALNALRSLRACGACGTRLTLRSGRPNGARRTGDALKTLYTLRPRRPDRTGNTLNALHALRPRRAQHILRRERRRRKRRG